MRAMNGTHLTYFIGGVNGVGKSTLLKRIQEKRPNDFEVISGSKLLMESLGIAGDYDALRALSNEQKAQAWAECVNQLLEAPRTANLLVDSHYVNLVNDELTV